MDRQGLLQRKQLIEQRFKEISAQLESVIQNKTNIEEELHKLQGEYRLVEDLITELDKIPPAVRREAKRLRKSKVENAPN